MATCRPALEVSGVAYDVVLTNLRHETEPSWPDSPQLELSLSQQRLLEPSWQVLGSLTRLSVCSRPCFSPLGSDSGKL